MKRHKIMLPMLRNGNYNFGHLLTLKSNIFFQRGNWGYFDWYCESVIHSYDQHLTWLSQLKPNVKVGQSLLRAPQLHWGPTEVGNAFNKSYNSFFCNRKTKERPPWHRSMRNVIANPVNISPFFSDMTISSDLHRSHGVSGQRLGWGWQVAPLAPPPPWPGVEN